MTVRRVLVLEAQVPFVHGGAEILVRQLVAALQRSGYAAEIASIPFRDHPRDELMAQVAAWRLVDVRWAADLPIDLVIPTKFPCYFVRHPAKVAWLMHQHRAAYELCGTPFSDFDHTELDVGIRDRLVHLDTQALGECAGLFSIAATVAARVKRYNGLDVRPVYHPPKLAARLAPGPYGDYIFLVTRLEKTKRVGLAIETFRHVDPPLRLVVAGDGSQRPELEALVERLGLRDRVSLLGRVDDEQVIDLYAGALGVLFAPYEEDYGYVTLEAFLARKPVVTARDAGGPTEFVVDGVNGFIAEPDAEALAARVRQLAADRGAAATMGDAGWERARVITWDGVVEQLVAGASGGRRGESGESGASGEWGESGESGEWGESGASGEWGESGESGEWGGASGTEKEARAS